MLARSSPGMNSSVPSKSPRYFYSFASLLLLVLVLAGFRYFYFEGKAFPGRELTPTIRSLLIAHGVLMTAWMGLAVVQPWLVAARSRRLHMKLGFFGAFLAAGVVAAGWMTGVEAARVAPPDLRLFGMDPKQFMTVPLGSIVIFAAFVAAGVVWRRRSEVHRPMMFLASLSVVSAALGRISFLNDWYAGTWLEQAFSAFLVMVLLGTGLLLFQWAVTRSFDRWFAAGLAGMTLASLALSLGARTETWAQFASLLLR